MGVYNIVHRWCLAGGSQDRDEYLPGAYMEGMVG